METGMLKLCCQMNQLKTDKLFPTLTYFFFWFESNWPWDQNDNYLMPDVFQFQLVLNSIFFPVDQTRYFKLENWKNRVQSYGDQWDYNKPVLLNTFVSQGSAKETGMEERNMCQRRECQKQPADYITSLVLWYPRVWLLLHGHGDSNFLDKPTSIFLLDSNLTTSFFGKWYNGSPNQITKPHHFGSRASELYLMVTP